MHMYEYTVIINSSLGLWIVICFRTSHYLKQCWLNLTFNSLTPGRFQFNFRKVIFRLTLVNGGWGISYEIVLRWMPQDLTDDKSTLVQVMAWCRQAASHYLNQCRPISVSPYGTTRPQRVNVMSLMRMAQCGWIRIACFCTKMRSLQL